MPPGAAKSSNSAWQNASSTGIPDSGRVWLSVRRGGSQRHEQRRPLSVTLSLRIWFGESRVVFSIYVGCQPSGLLASRSYDDMGPTTRRVDVRPSV